MAAEIRERPSNHHVPVRLQRDGFHEVRRLEAEGIDQARKLVVSSIEETGVQRAILEQSRQTDPARAVELAEGAAVIGLVVRTDRDRIDRIIEAGADVVGHVERAIGVQARDGTAGAEIHRAEGAANQNLVVGLDRHRVNRAVHAAARIEGQIQRAAGIEPRQTVDGHAVVLREFTTDHDLLVRPGGLDRGRVAPLRSKRGITLIHLDVDEGGLAVEGKGQRARSGHRTDARDGDAFVNHGQPIRRRSELVGNEAGPLPCARVHRFGVFRRAALR